MFFAIEKKTFPCQGPKGFGLRAPLPSALVGAGRPHRPPRPGCVPPDGAPRVAVNDRSACQPGRAADLSRGTAGPPAQPSPLVLGNAEPRRMPAGSRGRMAPFSGLSDRTADTGKVRPAKIRRKGRNCRTGNATPDRTPKHFRPTSGESSDDSRGHYNLCSAHCQQEFCQV